MKKLLAAMIIGLATVGLVGCGDTKDSEDFANQEINEELDTDTVSENNLVDETIEDDVEIADQVEENNEVEEEPELNGDDADDTLQIESLEGMHISVPMTVYCEEEKIITFEIPEEYYFFRCVSADSTSNFDVMTNPNEFIYMEGEKDGRREDQEFIFREEGGNRCIEIDFLQKDKHENSAEDQMLSYDHKEDGYTFEYLGLITGKYGEWEVFSTQFFMPIEFYAINVSYPFVYVHLTSWDYSIIEGPDIANNVYTNEEVIQIIENYF